MRVNIWFEGSKDLDYSTAEMDGFREIFLPFTEREWWKFVPARWGWGKSWNSIFKRRTYLLPYISERSLGLSWSIPWVPTQSPDKKMVSETTDDRKYLPKHLPFGWRTLFRGRIWNRSYTASPHHTSPSISTGREWQSSEPRTTRPQSSDRQRATLPMGTMSLTTMSRGQSGKIEREREREREMVWEPAEISEWWRQQSVMQSRLVREKWAKGRFHSLSNIIIAIRPNLWYPTMAPLISCTQWEERQRERTSWQRGEDFRLTIRQTKIKRGKRETKGSGNTRCVSCRGVLLHTDPHGTPHPRGHAWTSRFRKSQATSGACVTHSQSPGHRDCWSHGRVWHASCTGPSESLSLHSIASPSPPSPLSRTHLTSHRLKYVCFSWIFVVVVIIWFSFSKYHGNQGTRFCLRVLINSTKDCLSKKKIERSFKKDISSFAFFFVSVSPSVPPVGQDQETTLSNASLYSQDWKSWCVTKFA